MEYELFSRRQKRLRGEFPDVYQYETIPRELKVQIVHIWRDTLKSISFQSYNKKVKLNFIKVLSDEKLV